MIVAFITFLIGAVMVRYDDIGKFVDATSNKEIIYPLIYLLFLLAIAGTFFVGLAIFPYLKEGSQNSDSTKSRIFFGSIAKYDIDSYLILKKSFDENLAIEDLQRQIHIVAKGINTKYKYIGYAMFCFLGLLVDVSIISILIVMQ
jgi:hypothetical protein